MSFKQGYKLSLVSLEVRKYSLNYLHQCQSERRKQVAESFSQPPPGHLQKLDAPQILCPHVSLKKFHISPGFTACHVLSLTFTRWEAFGRRSWGQTAITCHLLFNSVHLHCGQTDGRNKNYEEETRFSMDAFLTWNFHG